MGCSLSDVVVRDVVVERRTSDPVDSDPLKSCCVCVVVCETLCVGCSLSDVVVRDVVVERRTSDPLASDVV